MVAVGTVAPSSLMAPPDEGSRLYNNWRTRIVSQNQRVSDIYSRERRIAEFVNKPWCPGHSDDAGFLW